MQGKLLNIPSYIEDPSYRYKMPKLELKIEGKGNGIKTNIVNLPEAAKALRVPTEYPLKFLGHELGSLTLYKENKNEITSIINGAFNDEEIRKYMDKFIEKYVLCPNCKYPEMVLKVKKGIVGGVCNSCGAKQILDNNHKLATFIVKNPPKNVSEFKDDKDSKTKKQDAKDEKKDDKKKPEKVEKSKGKDTHKDEEAKTSSQVEKENGQLPEKSTVPVKEKFSIANIDTYVNKVHDAYNKQNIDNYEDKETEINNLLKILESFEAPEKDLNRLSWVLFSGIFSVNIAKEIHKNKQIIETFYKNYPMADKELDLLLNLQYFMFFKHKGVGFEKYIPTILKFFYDEDLLDEDTLVAWDDNNLTEKIKKDFRYDAEVDEKFKNASRAILDWLKSAEQVYLHKTWKKSNAVEGFIEFMNE